jgi:heat shock protein HslJ
MRRPWIRLTLVAALSCATLIAAGCVSTAPAQDPKALEGVEWTLAGSSVSSADLSAFGITANFDGANLSGFSGVNQYSGPYTAKADGSLGIGALASTQMAGPEPAMKAEQAYMKLLTGCDGYKVGPDSLTLLTGGNETLTYEKAKVVTLPGTSWNVTSYNNGKGAVTTLAQGSEITLQFGTDAKVSGHGTVNQYGGSYKVEGQSLTIGPLAQSRMAGEQALMDQEAAYVKALESSTKWSVVQGRLELRDADGAAMVIADPAK